MTRSISFWRPTTGSSLPSAASLVRLRPNWSSSLLDFLSPLWPPRALALLAPAGAGQHADDLVADLLRVGVEVGEDARGDALVLAHEAEQDVLGADVVVAERERLPQRQLEHLLRPRGERDLPGGDLLARPDDADHLGADLLHRDLEALEHPGRQALLLAQQAQEDVLGPDVVVLEGARLFLRQHDDLARALREPFEHRDSPSYSPDPEDAKARRRGSTGVGELCGTSRGRTRGGRARRAIPRLRSTWRSVSRRRPSLARAPSGAAAAGAAWTTGRSWTDKRACAPPERAARRTSGAGGAPSHGDPRAGRRARQGAMDPSCPPSCPPSSPASRRSPASVQPGHARRGDGGPDAEDEEHRGHGRREALAPRQHLLDAARARRPAPSTRCSSRRARTARPSGPSSTRCTRHRARPPSPRRRRALGASGA